MPRHPRARANARALARMTTRARTSDPARPSMGGSERHRVPNRPWPRTHSPPGSRRERRAQPAQHHDGCCSQSRAHVTAPPWVRGRHRDYVPTFVARQWSRSRSRAADATRLAATSSNQGSKQVSDERDAPRMQARSSPSGMARRLDRSIQVQDPRPLGVNTRRGRNAPQPPATSAEC